jgi:single-stranded DNA-specific DHH superfamily exonuclease
MTTYPKPENLNGTELMAELAAVGVVVDRVKDNGDNTITLETDDKKGAAIVAKHNGTTVAPEPTIEAKLQSVGLNLNDLKAALGI